MNYLYVNLCALSGQGVFEVGETLRFSLDSLKDAKVIDVLQRVHNHLNMVRNDGTKIYKLTSASKTMNG